MSNPTSVQVKFVTAREAHEGWGLDIGPSPVAFVVTGFIEVDKVRVDRMAVVAQHFHLSREWGQDKASAKRTSCWDVEFMHDGEPQQSMICESLGEAMACARAYCYGATP